MTDIVEFLTARLDETQVDAEAAHAGPWVADLDDEVDENVTDASGQIVAWVRARPVTAATRAHIARHDPARVLAEVKAKRALMALHVISSRPEEWGDVRHHPDQDWPRTNYMGQLTGGTVYSCGICDIGADLDADGPLWRAEEACETVRWMAAPYAEHPDYKQEWQVG